MPGAMRMTIRHVYDFGSDRALVGDDLVRPEAWDALRTRSDGPFAMAQTRDEAERQALADPDLVARADALGAWLRREGVRRLVSYGVGSGTLELLLSRHEAAPQLVLTDYGPETVQQLRGLLPGAEVLRHDLLIDAPLDGDVHLFHRIDTEFDNGQLRSLLRRFADRRVLVIATGTVTVAEGLREVAYRFRNRNVSRAGWRRTRATFDALWRPTHEAQPLTFHDLPGWDLTPRAR
jgi:hypothetical protein